jgi:hypothetical protein
MPLSRNRYTPSSKQSRTSKGGVPE